MALLQSPMLKSGCFGASRPRPSLRSCGPVRAPLVTVASYKNKENIDLSSVAQYARAPTDVGSPEVQVARLTLRVAQLTAHLQGNRKDQSARRGLDMVLAQRKSLLQYLYRVNRSKYEQMISELGLKPVVVADTRGASRNTQDKATA